MWHAQFKPLLWQTRLYQNKHPISHGSARLPYGAFPTAAGCLAAGEAGGDVGDSILPTDGVPVVLGTRAARVALWKQGWLVISRGSSSVEKEQLPSRYGRNHNHLLADALCQVNLATPSFCSPLKLVSSHPHSSVNPYFSVIQRFSHYHTTYCETVFTFLRGPTNTLYSCIFSDFLR